MNTSYYELYYFAIKRRNDTEIVIDEFEITENDFINRLKKDFIITNQYIGSNNDNMALR